jgi:hypothetical protein
MSRGALLETWWHLTPVEAIALSRPDTFSSNSHASAGALPWASVRYWRICKG